MQQILLHEAGNLILMLSYYINGTEFLHTLCLQLCCACMMAATVLFIVLAIASASAIPLKDFYPFGNASGDSDVLHLSDCYGGCCREGCSPNISLSTPFPFYGTSPTILSVSSYT